MRRALLLTAILAGLALGYLYPPLDASRLYVYPYWATNPRADVAHYPLGGCFALFGEDSLNSIRMYRSPADSMPYFRLVTKAGDTVRFNRGGIYTNRNLWAQTVHYTTLDPPVAGGSPDTFKLGLGMVGRGTWAKSGESLAVDTAAMPHGGGGVPDTLLRGYGLQAWGTWTHAGESLAVDSGAVRSFGNTIWLGLLGKAADASGADSADVGVVSRSCTGNAATADSSTGGATRATTAQSLQGHDTTALFNAKTLQGKAASAFALTAKCTTLTTDGWWKKPTGIKAIRVEAIGGGGGGGGGVGDIAGTVRVSGGGGGGGAVASRWFPAGVLTDSVYIDIGAGGTAGTAGDSSGGTLTPGGVGEIGDTTKFGTTIATGLWAFGGGGGKGGVTNAVGAGGGGGGTAANGTSGSGTSASAGGSPGAASSTAIGGQGAQSVTGNNGHGGCAEYGGGSGGGNSTAVPALGKSGGSSLYAAGGGGGGGCIDASNTPRASGTGGTHGSYIFGGGGVGGGTDGSAGSPGSSGGGYVTCGAGGGGGGSNASGTGGVGGAGGTAGGGGGGGGGGTPTGGVGGVGGRGEVRIYYYF